MLSSSPSKIHEPLLTGVSPRPTDRRQHQKLRNTRGTLHPDEKIRADAQKVLERLLGHGRRTRR